MIVGVETEFDTQNSEAEFIPSLFRFKKGDSKMIVGVETGFDTQNSEVGIIPGLAYTFVYTDYAKGLNEWCRSYNDLIEEVIAVGGEICYNKMHLEMSGSDDNVWMVQWRDVDGHLNRREVHYTSSPMR